MKENLISLIVIFFAYIFTLIDTFLSPTSTNYNSLLIIASLSFLIHWIIFIPSYLNKTEIFYDITGTIAYIAMISLALFITFIEINSISIRSKIVSGLIIIWALRLGCFLLLRN